MNNVVTRSLVLLAVSTAIVLISAFVAPPANPAHTTAITEQGEAKEPATHDMSMTVDSEAAFITSMILHHREAVESARAVLETTQRPEIRELARDVIATQTEEIATLEGWHEQWYPDAAEADYTPMMADPTELSLEKADRTFLEGMVEHHQGAIGMARSYLEASYEKRGEVVELAEAIVNAQTGEITQMQDWLNEWYGEVGADHDAH